MILEDLERAKTIDPPKSAIDASLHYLCYTSAASTMVAKYYATGGSPESRNPEMLKLLAQVRELARQNPTYNEAHWKWEDIDY